MRGVRRTGECPPLAEPGHRARGSGGPKSAALACRSSGHKRTFSGTINKNPAKACLLPQPRCTRHQQGEHFNEAIYSDRLCEIGLSAELARLVSHGIVRREEYDR